MNEINKDDLVKRMDGGKAYIVFTPTGVGKTKKIDIELVNLVEGDRQVMTLALNKNQNGCQG